MFRFWLFGPMGDDAGEVELVVPAIQPGETIMAGGGRKLLVLDAAYELPEDSPYRGLLTVEPLE